MDFIRGAALGEDGLGKPIIAMTSVTDKGESKIVPFLKPGTFYIGTISVLTFCTRDEKPNSYRPVAKICIILQVTYKCSYA